uniref:Uncharacterized protein n=1 Tax=viral metagenome TaxID=1070528 RepID=A0A6C0DBX2_9ZZZZ
MTYQEKYLKYKNKYLQMKDILGGASLVQQNYCSFDYSEILSIIPEYFTNLTELQTTYPNIEIKGNRVLKINIFTPQIFQDINRRLSPIQPVIILRLINNTKSFEEINSSNFTDTEITRLLQDDKVIYKFILSPRIITKDLIEHYKYTFNEILKQEKVENVHNEIEPRGILYKCDYDFTQVRYRNYKQVYQPVITIFDSGNSSSTLIHNSVVTTLGLNKIPIIVSHNSIIAFNNIMDELKLEGSKIDLSINLTMDEFIFKIDNVADHIREYYRKPKSNSENNEDLLIYFNIRIASGVGGVGSVVKYTVLLPFEIIGTNKKYYIEAHVNDAFEGILFSKHDMALLEKRSISFGYNSAFEERHNELETLRKQYDDNEEFYDLQTLIYGRQSRIIRSYHERRISITKQMRVIRESFVPIIDIFATLPPCSPGIALGRSDSGGHTEVKFETTFSPETVFEQIFQSIPAKSEDEKLLILSKLKDVKFTEEQLEQLMDIFI